MLRLARKYPKRCVSFRSMSSHLATITQMRPPALTGPRTFTIIEIISTSNGEWRDIMRRLDRSYRLRLINILKRNHVLFDDRAPPVHSQTKSAVRTPTNNGRQPRHFGHWAPPFRCAALSQQPVALRPSTRAFCLCRKRIVQRGTQATSGGLTLRYLRGCPVFLIH